MGGQKRGPEGQCRANCRYRAERRNPWSCDYASITGKTRLGACRRRGAGTDVGECPLYAPREKSKKAINAAVLFVVMVVAVCVTTIRCGEAEAERFADAGKMMSETGETDSTPRVLASADRIIDPGGDWRRVALLLGMTAPAVVKYDSATEEPPVEEPPLIEQSAAASDEDYILRVITAEGGADQLVCNGVTQCLYNACRRDDWVHSVTEILREYQYACPAEWISEEARIAWDAVFLSGVTFVDFGEALYFYAPAYCESPWHESQRFICEIHGVRFFGRW